MQQRTTELSLVLEDIAVLIIKLAPALVNAQVGICLGMFLFPHSQQLHF